MSDPFIGEIKMFGGNFAPRGYAMCLGQLMSISQNNALYAVLGTLYGGNGQTTFGLPNFQGRSPVGMGTGTGLQPVVQGAIGGAETATLLSTNLPSIQFPLQIQGTVNLSIPASTADGTSPVPGPNLVLAKPVDSAVGAEVSPYGSNPDTTLKPFNAPLNASNSTANYTGQSLPVKIRNPFLGTNFIIALMGEFPTRN